VYLTTHTYSICLCMHCNTLQHTATHGNTLQHTATDNSYLLYLSMYVLQHTATHCNTLQHMATHCNTLQLTTHTYSICLCIYLYIHCVYSFVPRARMADGVFACVTCVLHFSVHLCIYTLYSLRCRASGWLAACVYVT